MTSIRVSTVTRGQRQVSTSPDLLITIWTLVALLSTAAGVANLIVGDWGDALDAAAAALPAWLLASRHRDVNALMGGHQ